MTHEEWKDRIETALRNAEEYTLINIYNTVYREATIGRYGDARQYVLECHCDYENAFEELALLYENNVPFSGNFYKSDGIHYELDIADYVTDLIDDFDFDYMTDEIMKDPFKYICISTDDEFNELLSDYKNWYINDLYTGKDDK